MTKNSTSPSYIGINQRIPFSVLDEALGQLLLTGDVKRSEILQNMLQITQGKNRAEKASMYAGQIISRPKTALEFLKKRLGAEAYARLPEEDRKAIILCLASCTYPIFYNLISVAGAVFKVQKQVSRAFLREKMAAIYGSNRTLWVGVDAIMPMLVELDVLKREKVGIYAAGSRVPILQPVVSELYIYTDIALSGSKSVSIDEINHRPWYFFHEVEFSQKLCTGLLKASEGRVGGGYVGI